MDSSYVASNGLVLLGYKSLILSVYSRQSNSDPFTKYSNIVLTKKIENLIISSNGSTLAIATASNIIIYKNTSGTYRSS